MGSCRYGYRGQENIEVGRLSAFVIISDSGRYTRVYFTVLSSITGFKHANEANYIGSNADINNTVRDG
jgi:hypothetical protein